MQFGKNRYPRKRLQNQLVFHIILVKGGSSKDNTYLYYLYDAAYAGMRSSVFADTDERVTNDMVGELCRYAFGYYTGWTPEQTIEYLSDEYLELMRLDPVVEKLRLPQGIPSSEHLNYLLWVMYPKDAPCKCREDGVIHCYEDRLKTGEKMPCNFFYGTPEAEQNGRICLLHALNEKANCKSKRECVEFLRSKDAATFLKSVKLYNHMQKHYHSPLVYLADALAKYQYPGITTVLSGQK